MGTRIREGAREVQLRASVAVLQDERDETPVEVMYQEICNWLVIDLVIPYLWL